MDTSSNLNKFVLGLLAGLVLSLIAYHFYIRNRLLKFENIVLRTHLDFHHRTLEKKDNESVIKQPSVKRNSIGFKK